MKIVGTAEACAFLRRYPLECNKIILRALRESVKPVSTRVRSAVPYPQWRRLVKVKAKESRATGRLYAVAGMRDDGKVQEGSKIPDWFKAYWLNYGTLTRRDAGHTFTRAPRGSSSRNKKGSPKPDNKYRNFYDHAVEGLDKDITDKFLKSIERQHARLLDKIK